MIDKLRKHSQARKRKPKKMIPRPHGTIRNLQHAMRLKDDRDMYTTYRVTGLVYFFCVFADSYQGVIRDLIIESKIPKVDWRHQDPEILNKIIDVVCSFSFIHKLHMWTYKV